ncbi:AAA family ATPase [Leucothrix pacifica]|uniref:ATPase AAA-type core domain-containing protein n=1 Tax=Leucothrix pacifica TaxID=1247513 RepID=A0A317CJH3_9GAMM|nr:ATP-binding protein [Leucothrix pacifica]PWQ96480.1 hypothetical protein DKW60_13055 [Leucothrix pacifica]
MITKFEVKNFKNFDDWFCFDLSNTKNYSFRPECISDGVVSKALIYGPNGSGKSNLGFAMLDLTRHLSGDRIASDNYEHYFPIGSNHELAEFRYSFVFDGDDVVYEYGKSDKNTLVYESLTIQDEQVLQVDRRESTTATINLKGAETLKTDMGESSISLVTYIKNNSLLDDNRQNDLFEQFIKQASGMLFFRSLKDYRSLGAKLRHRTVSEFLSSEQKVGHLEKFLNDAGIACSLELVETDSEPVLMFVKNGKKAPFAEIASTGTHSLVVLYFWWQQLVVNPDISFVYIDEFDAFYHHELSRLVIRQLCQLNAQVILTTHNTSIMSNDILRPDCYFLLNKQQIGSLADKTEKELRSAHNIEKMYRAGAFGG